MNYLFSKFFQLPLTGTLRNCTITYPQSHRKCDILRWYEWDLLVFCKQTSFLMSAIGTLKLARVLFLITSLKGLKFGHVGSRSRSNFIETLFAP